MSTENPIISNFVGLEKLQSLLSTCTFTLELPQHETLTLPDVDDGRTVFLSKDELRHVGMKLSTQWTYVDMKEACDSAGINLDDIHFVIIVEDAAMKLRSVITSIGLSDWEGEYTIIGSGERPVDSWLNDRSGFNLELVLALSSDLEFRSGRPHRKGTSLAKHSFSVRVEVDLGGLNPLPLTTEVLQSFKLPAKTTSFIDVQDDLLEVEQLGDAICLYLNENLLETLKIVRSRNSLALQSIAALDFQKQIIFRVSRELKALSDDERADHGDDTVVRMIASWVKEVGRYDKGSLIDEIANRPETVCAWISSRNDLAAKTADLLGNEREEQMEVR